MTAGWVVVIPVKGTAEAKTRLGEAAPDRWSLASAFARDTISAALAAGSVREVIVVTGSAELGAMAETLGARALLETGHAGLNPSIEQGIAQARLLQPQAPIAVLLGDLPALHGDQLDDALRRAGRHPRAMVADAAGIGTVLTCALPAHTHIVRFGGASRAAHRAAGYVELDVDRESGLRRDVDTRQELAALDPAELGAATRAVLAAERDDRVRPAQ